MAPAQEVSSLATAKREGARLQSDAHEVRCRRLVFRCWHRGTQEIDLILGSFAESAAGRLSPAQLDRFEALLDCDDADLFDWITGQSTLPPAHDHDVMRMLRASIQT